MIKRQVLACISEGIFMLYDRRIKYLNYIVGGERMQAAGFVKAEVRDEVCRMQIHVNGLHLSGSFERKIMLRNADGDSFLKMIKIEDGKGDTGELILNTSRMGSGSISYGGLEEIVIPIDNGKEISCIWNSKAGGKTEQSKTENRIPEQSENVNGKTMQSKTVDRKPEQTEAGSEKTEKSKTIDGLPEQTEVENEKAENEKEEYGIAESVKSEHVENDMEKDKSKSVDCDKSEDMHATQITSDEICYEQPKTDSQYPRDDKWRQLSALYDHGKVFGEMSDCLLIRPGDFVILPDKYYKLVNNSFLLHGYHNYGYLVLARTEKRGEIKYYIGVPGNFFEKEKQVAIMFGFESFECGKPYIQPGDFGYYMIKVEL